MQNAVLKFITLSLIIVTSIEGNAQVSSFRLQQADSLFENKRYTQAFEQYQAILDNKEYTPAMLLKMAYIQEGLNQPGNALYYLNLYHLVSNDKAVIQKMEDLAQKHNLDGYKSTDLDRVMLIYKDYREEITLGLGVVMIFLLSLSFYFKIRKKEPVIGLFVTACFLAVAFFAHLNFGERFDTGIIMQPNTYIMSGPSAGASVLSIVNEGHRVEVIGKKDVWLKIIWNGVPAYVKQEHLMPIAL